MMIWIAICDISTQDKEIKFCHEDGTGCLCSPQHCRDSKYPGLSRSLDNITSGGPFQATSFCVSMAYMNNLQKNLPVKCSRLLFKKDKTRHHNLNVYFSCIASIPRPYTKKSQRRRAGYPFQQRLLYLLSVYTIVRWQTGRTTKKTPNPHY